ncbi:major capsid protein [bacterium 210820-DFI.6.37]|nr:major capsid protein [bacterium 210820-DFI.6.37]
MSLDIYKTHTLLMAVRQLLPPVTFLRDRYFPTNEATDIFATNDVLIEYKDGNRKLAPFVSPRKAGVTVLRNGSNMEKYEPPNIAPKRTLTIDELEKRDFGEALLTQLTPEQREGTMILNDIKEMGELIARREETMAAAALLENGYIMKHIADDKTKPEEKYIQFYEGDSNPATYTPAVPWGTAGANIFGDLYAMAELLAQRGLPATEFVCAPDVAAAVINDENVQKQLDIRNYNVGRVEPKKLPDGASLIAELNCYGKQISVISYAETYEDDDETTKQMIPSGNGFLSAPAAGRTLYGAVTQLEQTDGRFHTYRGRQVPKYLSDPHNNVREIILTSKPLLIPNNKNAWISGKFTE